MVITTIALTCRVISVFILDYIAMAILHLILGIYASAAFPMAYILGIEGTSQIKKIYMHNSIFLSKWDVYPT